MAFDWRDFFLFAHELRNETDESKQRTSVGRAYYYAYNAALIEAQKLGFNPNAPAPRIPGKKPSGVHQKLWDWCMSQTGNQDLINLGDSGNTLKGRRTAADYKIAQTILITTRLVQQQLDETRDFEVLLAQIAKASPPPPLL
jgi:hypothetical protein